MKPENNYKIYPPDLDDFLHELPEEQHLLILNNPHNPTGAVYSKDELEGIAEVCRRHDTLVLADEIYALLSAFLLRLFVKLPQVRGNRVFF